MNSTSKVINLVVKNDLCIGCGLCTYKCPNKALEMKWNDFGFLVPELTGNCDLIGNCITVCPFNPFPEKEVETENELAGLFLNDTTFCHPKIGKYLGIYAGYAEEFRLTSSSGGIATYIFTELLQKGIVDHIFSVKESAKPGTHYEYSISNTKQELLAASQTKYYPVTLSTVFSKIAELEGKIAIVGVACFTKAIRLAQYNEPALKEKIPFLVGIICGGVKSRFYTEYLASKMGITEESILDPQFRIKNLLQTAGDYSFGCVNKENNTFSSILMNPLGDMWGTGMFKSNACDFCDDVTTELSDISLGDAWFEPFIKDGRGNNTIITRSALSQKLIMEGIKSNKICLTKITLKDLIDPLQGAFNHRQLGLNYRIREKSKKGIIIPPKRFYEKYFLFDFKIVQKLRMKTRENSLIEWKLNKCSFLFDKKLDISKLKLKRATKYYHLRRAYISKRFIKRIVAIILNR